MGSIEPESQASPPPLPNNYYQSQNGNYIIKEQPIGALRHIRVIGIGAGASGINMIRTLKLNTTSFEHVIYERNADIGGTWYENRYPGCKCDIPSHSYQFSHTPNPGWSALFSEAGEIQNYLQHVCDKYDLRENIKLSHSIIHAIWEETAGQWVLKVRNEITGVMFEDRCHFLLDSSGILKSVAPCQLWGHMLTVSVIGNGLISRVFILFKAILYTQRDGLRTLTTRTNELQ